MKKTFSLYSITISIIILLCLASNALADSTPWQNQNKVFQSAQTKYSSNLSEYFSISSDLKLTKSKEILLSTTNLINEYLKLIKMEVEESKSLKDEDRSSFKNILDTNISNIDKISSSINGISVFSDFAKIQDDINNNWQNIQAAKKYMVGVILVRKSEQTIEKTNQLIVTLQDDLSQISSNNPYYELITSEFESAKKDIEMASQTKDESLTLFNSVSKDYANANTLYNEGRSKIRKAHIYIKQSIKVLEKINSQLTTQLESSKESSNQPTNTATDNVININEFNKPN